MTQNHISPYKDVTDKQHAFILSYLLDYNVTAACKRTGQTPTTAHRWLTEEPVQAMLLEKAKEIEQVADISKAEVLNELKRVAFFDLKNFIEDIELEPEDGKFGLKLKDLSEIDTRAVQSIQVKSKDGVPYVDIKPYDKIAALKELLMHLNGPQPKTNIHVHLTDEKVKNMTAMEVSAQYQTIVNPEDN